MLIYHHDILNITQGFIDIISLLLGVRRARIHRLC